MKFSCQEKNWQAIFNYKSCARKVIMYFDFLIRITVVSSIRTVEILPWVLVPYCPYILKMLQKIKKKSVIKYVCMSIMYIYSRVSIYYRGVRRIVGTHAKNLRKPPQKPTQLRVQLGFFGEKLIYMIQCVCFF